MGVGGCSSPLGAYSLALVLSFFPLLSEGLGGGHYAPRFNDLLRQREDVELGHILGSHSLHFPHGQWQAAVMEAVRSTARAHPGGRPVEAYIDRKAFKGPDRQRLTDFLDSQCVRWTFKAEELGAKR